MKLTSLSLLATGAIALVLPDHIAADRPQAPVTVSRGREFPQRQDEDRSSPSWWWDNVLPSGETIESAIDEGLQGLDALNSGIAQVVHAADSIQDDLKNELAKVATPHGGGHHDFPDLTIYQVLHKNKYTKKFAALVDEHEDIVKLLNTTGSTNYTLFAPVDAAFDDIPEDHPKPGKDFIEAVLRYHIGVGEYRAHKILTTNTIPTALNEKFLGDEPQRLRTSLGLWGVTVNFYSRVVAADIGAKNGVVHGVRSLLGPPPMIGRILTLFPAEFSTLLLAYEKTDFVKYIHGIEMDGSTVFAPSNRAFAALGPRANAFLFNTEKGLKYLKALLKYHIAPDATLYSDAFYDKTDDSEADGLRREHYDLKSLLHEAHIGVDMAFFAGLTSIKVNGFVNVRVRDAPGKNGVIHVVDKVLIPPCKHKHHHDADLSVFDEVSVEELMERLGPYVETDETPLDGFEL